MRPKDALVLLNEIRQNKYWLPTAPVKRFLEDVDFQVRISKRSISDAQATRLTEVWAIATGKDCSTLTKKDYKCATQSISKQPV